MFDKLFTYKHLQEACADTFGFSDVTLLRDIGDFEKGMKIDVVWYHVERAELELYGHAECDETEGPLLGTFKVYLGEAI